MPFPCRRSPRAQTLIQKAFTELELVFNVADARRFRNTTIQDVQVQCLSSECIKAFETLIKAYAKIGESLGRFERLRSAFASDLGFQQILAIYYRDIAKFHEHAYKFVSVNGWRLFFRTTWGRFEGQFTTTLDNLKRHGELIDQETNTKNAIAIQKLLDLESRRNEELRRVQNARKEESNRQYKDIISQLQVQQSESDQDSICKSLAKAQGEHDGTCSWIWKHGKTAAWLSETDDTHTLWLQGSAGSGKSILADNLAKYLTLKGQVVVCHFCSELYDSSTDYDQILKSIISQLAELSSESIAYTHEILMGQKKLTNPILVGIVKALVPLISGQSGTKCKVLLTSRDEPRGNSSRRPPTVLLSEHKEHLKSSIQLYVLNRLRSLEMAERLRQLDINGDKVTDLGNKITAKADGMFLYARLIVDFLSRQLFPTAGRLEEAIDNPPQELKDFIQPYIVSAFSQQSQEAIQSAVFAEDGPPGTAQAASAEYDVVSQILSNYRDTVSQLLRQGYCHGISKEEFDFFSSHAKNPLFTCRIPLCPRALMGFETEPELRNHEYWIWIRDPVGFMGSGALFVGPEDMDLDLPPNHSLSDIFGAVRQGNFGNR
ncbi:unnamed protein product [Parascedosporium putredinis]|uniref:Nephrocystin 3-like N-terminal domain-containing protein n=1 Tax=Parascedosporium putredinis TaxID=1442378 RepID=A0A9P1H9C7_9PEZI|nr:unnamed protein product [Parascedosporium putredinis]CAI8003345.1 unnamed protein product [Parascedosporium putredinis]